MNDNQTEKNDINAPTYVPDTSEYKGPTDAPSVLPSIPSFDVPKDTAPTKPSFSFVFAPSGTVPPPLPPPTKDNLAPFTFSSTSVTGKPSESSNLPRPKDSSSGSRRRGVPSQSNRSAPNVAPNNQGWPAQSPLNAQKSAAPLSQPPNPTQGPSPLSVVAPKSLTYRDIRRMRKPDLIKKCNELKIDPTGDPYAMQVRIADHLKIPRDQNEKPKARKGNENKKDDQDLAKNLEQAIDVQSHHPTYQYSRDLLTYDIMTNINRFPATQGWVLDIYGVPSRIVQFNCKYPIWTICATSDAEDHVRIARAQASGNHHWCTCTLQEVISRYPNNCCARSSRVLNGAPLVAAIMIHSVYRVDPDQVLQLTRIASHPYPVQSVHFNFHQPRATLGDNEGTYFRTAGGYIVHSVHGNNASYVHKDQIWLRNSNHYTNSTGTMAWSSLRQLLNNDDPLYHYVFVKASHITARFVPNEHDVLRDESVYCEVDLRRLTAASSQPQRSAWYKAPELANQSVFSAGKYLLVDSDPLAAPKLVPKAAVVDVAIHLAGTERSERTYAMCQGYARNALRRENLAPHEQSQALPYVVAMAMLEQLDNEIATLEHLVSKWNKFAWHRFLLSKWSHAFVVTWLYRIASAIVTAMFYYLVMHYIFKLFPTALALEAGFDSDAAGFTFVLPPNAVQAQHPRPTLLVASFCAMTIVTMFSGITLFNSPPINEVVFIKDVCMMTSPTPDVYYDDLRVELGMPVATEIVRRTLRDLPPIHTHARIIAEGDLNSTCTERSVARVMGHHIPPYPNYARCCVHNEYYSVRSRVTKNPTPQKTGSWNTAYKTFSSSGHYSRLLDTPFDEVTFEDWLNRYPGSKRKHMLNYLNTAESKRDVSDYSDVTYDAFIKIEAVLKDDWDPRMIQAMPPEYQLVIGPHALAMSKHLARVFTQRLVFDRHNISLTYASGLNAAQLGEWYDQCLLLELVAAFEADASRYDSDVKQDALRTQFRLYQAVSNMDGPTRNAYLSQLYTRGRTRHGVKYSVRGQTKSGTSNTTVGNSSMNLVMSYDIIRTIKNKTAYHSDPVAVIVMGDDLLIMTTPRFAKALMEHFSGLALTFGFNVKVASREHPTFCSGYFYPVRLSDGCVKHFFGPMLGKLLSKVFIVRNTLLGRHAEEYTAAIAQALKATYPHVPILREICTNLLRRYKFNPDVKISAQYLPVLYQPGMVCDVIPSRETYQFLHDLYDVPAHTLIKIANELVYQKEFDLTRDPLQRFVFTTMRAHDTK